MPRLLILLGTVAQRPLQTVEWGTEPSETYVQAGYLTNMSVMLDDDGSNESNGDRVMPRIDFGSRLNSRARQSSIQTSKVFELPGERTRPDRNGSTATNALTIGAEILRSCRCLVREGFSTSFSDDRCVRRSVAALPSLLNLLSTGSESPA